MEGTANSNAGLMRRIVQLETEKDELQQDIEKLCMQQSGTSGSNDIISHMQTHRAAGFEQELEACKQKLALHAKENLNLQEELAGTYQAKGRVADAFKAAMDKNKELEKEVKFYQSRMAGAFTERDKAFLEVERLHASEKTTSKELRELRHRLEQTMAQCREQEESFAELEQSMQNPILELERVQKVVEKFWQLRESAKDMGDLHEEVVDKAQVLLEDNDANWVYRLVSDTDLEDSCTTAEVAMAQVKEELALSKVASSKLEEDLSLLHSTSTKLEEELTLSKSASTKLKEELIHIKAELMKLEEELELAKATSMDLKLQLEEEHLARKEAEGKTSAISDQLALHNYTAVRELHHLRARQVALKSMVSAFLETEKRQISLVLESLQHVIDKMKVEELQQETELNLEEKDVSEVQDIPHDRKGLRVHFEDEEVSQGTNISKEGNDTSRHNILSITGDDSRQVLAQAMQEKVEALLLLSQQEERYYLEASTQAALESQVTVLNQKLSQVTGEKVKALMELAEEKQQIQRLQEQERELTQWLEQQGITYPGGRVLRGSHSETKEQSPRSSTSINQTLEDKLAVKTKQRSTASGGYLKGWLRGLDISAFKTTSSVTTSNSNSNSSVVEATPGSKNDNANSVVRLLVENAALQERVASMQHLAKSAHHLRMMLVKVASEAQGQLAPPSIQSAIEVVESVKSEAKQLTLSRGSSLPVSFQVPIDGSPQSSHVEPSREEILEGNDGEREGASQHDSISMVGMEIAELLLATADQQTESLLARLKLASTN